MASEEEGGSLFEGMVLFTPSDLSSPSEIPPSVTSADPPPLPLSQPLDEDLFSNLTLLSAPPSSDDLPSVLPSPSRQISRKKKRAVRVGYARDDEVSPPPPFSPSPRPLDSNQSEHRRDKDISCAVLPENKVADNNEVGDIHLVDGRLPVTEVSPPMEKDEVVSVEEKLDLIKTQVSNKLDRLREMAVLLASQRKQLGRRRRKAAESVNSVSQKYKELEKELEEACEAEDFERAERVSESLAATEKEKDILLTAFKEAEADCDAADLKMQELLDSQIAAEEEGVALLEQLGKVTQFFQPLQLLLQRANLVSHFKLVLNVINLTPL